MPDDLAALERFLAVDVRAAILDAVKPAMEQGARELVALMRSAVPVRSGDLRDSIGWTWDAVPDGAFVRDTLAGPDGLRITIYAGSRLTERSQARASGTRRRDHKRKGRYTGGNANNARYQEFGTARMGANPFFWPSYRALKARIRNRITRAANGAMRGFA